MAEYARTPTDDVVIRTTDGANIPVSSDNADAIAYRAWLDSGGVPEPYEAPPPSAEELCDEALLADADRQALLSAIRTATPGQIKTYIQNNVTDMPSARLMLIRLTLLVAVLVRR